MPPAEIARVFREEYGRAVAEPAGWIITTARNRAVDRLRRENVREDRHAEAARLRPADVPRTSMPRRDPCVMTGSA